MKEAQTHNVKHAIPGREGDLQLMQTVLEDRQLFVKL
jgi:hypothetical protein